MPSHQLGVQKRQHRERSQPANRKRLGLLEKHKDYVIRAKDYRSKRDRLKKLREKAAAKNKDEFYFGMIRGRTEKGVHIQSRGNEALPPDLVKLLKTQDVKYIHVQRAMEQKKIKVLRDELGCMTDLADTAMPDDEGDSPNLIELARPVPSASSGADPRTPARPRRTLFTDNLEDLQSRTVAALRQRLRPTPGSNTTRDSTEPSQESPPRKKRKKNAPSARGIMKSRAERVAEAKSHRESLVTELQARLIREKALARAQRELEVQRLLMGKGATRQLVGKPKREAADDFDDDDFDSIKPRKRPLPVPEVGIATQARVWKWKQVRRR